MRDEVDGPIRILLIEDNPDDVIIVERNLRSESQSYTIKVVDRVAESLPLLDERMADLILLDLGLPDSTGLESFHRLRAQAPDVPIIILTGKADLGTAREAVRNGAQDYLIKGQLEGNLLLHAVHYAAERHALHQELEELSLRDPLTGLYNRRGFWLLAEQSLLLAKRNGRESVLLLADIDRLKTINDTYGHPVGDQALCAVARAFVAAMRESDIIARLAGDEFVALAVEAHPPGILSLISRFRERLRDERRVAEGTADLTVSIGSAPFDPTTSPTLEELMDLADKAMYMEKRSGSHIEQGRLNGDDPEIGRAPERCTSEAPHDRE
jgi:two-component system cell cycle response regulator